MHLCRCSEGSTPGRDLDVVGTRNAGCSSFHEVLVGQRREQPMANSLDDYPQSVYVCRELIECTCNAKQRLVQKQGWSARHCVNVNAQRVNLRARGICDGVGNVHKHSWYDQIWCMKRRSQSAVTSSAIIWLCYQPSKDCNNKALLRLLKMQSLLSKVHKQVIEIR